MSNAFDFRPVEAPEVGKLQTGPLGLDSPGTRGKSETYRELVQAEHETAEQMAQRAAQRVEEWQRPSPEEYARRVAQGLR